jgi:hypothetical protein
MDWLCDGAATVDQFLEDHVLYKDHLGVILQGPAYR